MKAETMLNAFALAYHDSCRLAIWRPGEDTRAKWQRRMRQYQRFRTWLLRRMGEPEGSQSVLALPLHSFPSSALGSAATGATRRPDSSERRTARRDDRRKRERNRP